MNGDTLILRWERGQSSLGRGRAAVSAIGRLPPEAEDTCVYVHTHTQGLTATLFLSFHSVNTATLLLGVESQHKVSVPRAPTKDEMSLRAYTARCRLNRLRRAACRLFTSETMVKAIKKLEIEIEAGRLMVRKDRHLWKDVGKKIIESEA